MIFSSLEFLIYFLPIFLILYASTSVKYRNVTLLLGSLVFYTWGQARYLPVLLLSVAVNFFVGLYLRTGSRGKGKKGRADRRGRKWLLILAIAGNVGLLAVFKIDVAGIGLPVGMSFYTFQILSYLIDVFRGEIPAEKSLISFAAYITMFPKLTSGPVVSNKEMSMNVYQRKMTVDGVQRGLMLFTVGLALKVLLADRVGILWHKVQVTGFESLSTPFAWLGAIAFSLNIYFDFYGYSLMAVGLGTMLGFSLPDNFREPYMALSVRDFYRRWHITLGKWFCRYVYIPLGGSRRGELRTVMNLLAVWLLTAVWHGITPNFLLWGLSLWLLIVVERQVGNVMDRHPIKGRMIGKFAHGLRHLYLWAVIPVTWMCFAITDIGQLKIYLGRMFGLIPPVITNGMDWKLALQDFGFLLLAAGAACLPLWKKCYRRWKDRLLFKIVVAALFWLCVWRISVEGNNPFMYLRF